MPELTVGGFKGFCFLWGMIFFALEPLAAADSIVLRGHVYNAADRKPAAFASVALVEDKIKTSADAKGRYCLEFPRAGAHTVVVRAQGLAVLETRVVIERSAERDFWLQPLSVAGEGVTIVGSRDIQKVSRHTVTSRELGSVPATLGDALNALITLPGIVRTSDFFGQMVARGAMPASNRYSVDGIPLHNPQHFGGLHTVIPGEFVSTIDLYSSAFPARYGGSTAAVVDVNTVDDVAAFGGWADIGLLSASAMLKIPITRNILRDENYEDENRGYVIVSGRYGYLAQIIPLVYEAIGGQELAITPEYWDYQVKAKYVFNTRHSLSLLALGSRDYVRAAYGESDDPAVDPLTGDYRMRMDLMSFTQGLTYRYRNGNNLCNELTVYALVTDVESSERIDNPSLSEWARLGYADTAGTGTYGLKNMFRFSWPGDAGELIFGAEAALYDFNYSGNTVVPKHRTGILVDVADPEMYVNVAVRPVFNVTAGGFLENRFTWKGLTLTPGVRVEYLDRSGRVIADPRLSISYEWSSGTTLSLAGGLYSSFYQTNPNYFYLFEYVAGIGKGLAPERSAQGVLGLEQKVFIFIVRAEGFVSYYWDMGMASYYLDNYFDNSGRLLACGAELTLKVERGPRSKGFSGWISYAYTRSKYRSGHPDVYENGVKIIAGGGRFVSYDYEQEHAVKLVLEYTHTKHSIGARFQLNSSYPYTPITGSVESPAGTGRYFPTCYGAEKNSRHFPVNHRLDLRYTYTSRHEWGHVSWYIELINVYYNIPATTEIWKYDRPYARGKNPVAGNGQFVPGLIPNFGVEVKF